MVLLLTIQFPKSDDCVAIGCLKYVWIDLNYIIIYLHVFE